MNKKNLLISGVSILLIAVVCGSVLLISKDNKQEEKKELQKNEVLQPEKTEQQKIIPAQKVQKIKEEKIIKKANLYSDSPSSLLPFSAMSELAILPQNIQKTVNSLLENSQSMYFLNQGKDKVTLLLEGASDSADKYPRHELELVNISLTNGHVSKKSLGEVREDNSTEYDIWEFDESNPDAKLPLKHTKLHKNGSVDFTETWNYEHDEPVKYKMQDGDGKIISMKKDVQESDTSLRQEHIFYDKDGNTKMNVSVNYDGSDITRFTYYNAEKPEEGTTIISEFENGEKKKETVYTSDFKVKNVYTSNYKNGTREDITILDNENREIEKILAE